MVDKKWTAFCLPTQNKSEENKPSKTSETAADLGMKGGATIGGLGGAKAGGIIGATMATTSCLASLGLTAASFGATTLLSVGVCGAAIAGGTATGVAIGGGIGGTLGGFIGKYGVQGVLSYFDAENCVNKELTVKTPNDQAPTYECEVWCDACKIIQHSRNHLVYASKSQHAETKAKDEYIVYFTENKTSSDIMARHNQHDHLKATCERIKGTE